METIFGTAGTATSAPDPSIFAFLFFFGSILIGSSGSIWVKRHANRTADVYNSTHSFNVLLVLFETVFFLVASVIVGLINTDVSTFSWDFGTIICAIIRAVAYVLGMVGYLMAVRHGPLLLTVVVLRMGLALPILLSAMIWPSSAVTWYNGIGMVLMIVALILFNRKESGDTVSARTTPKFWFWVLIGAVGNGMEGFAVKLLETEYQIFDQVTNEQIGGASLENCLFYASVLQIVFFLAIMFACPPQRTSVGADGLPTVPAARPTMKAMLLAGLIGGGWIMGYAVTNATSFYTSSLMVGYLPTAFYFMANTGFSILIAFAIARFIFREKLRTAQYIGCVIAVIGLILLNNWDKVFGGGAAPDPATTEQAARALFPYFTL